MCLFLRLIHSAKNLLSRLETTKKRKQEAQFTLEQLEVQSGHEVPYFAEQWTRQKEMQLEAITKKRQKYIEELGELLDLEEKLEEAQ